ncbi:MAG: hypothetical protein GEU75_15360 [Dehalococcoidia bacterium]|nr:hypothetical protein [Dehalococcoidia bacterium]
MVSRTPDWRIDAGTGSAGGEPGTAVRLRDGVATVRRARGQVLLVSENGTPPLRVSGIGEELLPLLAEGTTLEALTEYLRARYPAARDIEPKLPAFLTKLRSVGLLSEGASQRHRGARGDAHIPLPNPDPLARQLALLLRHLPADAARVALVLALAATLAGIVGVFLETPRPHPFDLVLAFSPAGLAILLLMVLPFHEFGHAVACRMAGAPVVGAGVTLYRYVVPKLYVNNTAVYRVAGRGPRVWIALAGPLVNVLVAGAAAWVAVATGDGWVEEAARYVVAGCLVTLVLGISPLAASDGSHALEALLDDDLARGAALFRGRSHLSIQPVIYAYRLVCALYLLAFCVGSGALVAGSLSRF